MHRQVSPTCVDAVQGYQIEWSEQSHQRYAPGPHRFSNEEMEPLDLEIQRMLDNGATSLSTIFLIPKKGGGHRPIINLKKLNKFVPHLHFQMEGIHMLKDLLKQGDFMGKIDLKDAYFAVPISKSDRKYLRFWWRNKIYQFNSLPSGLSCVPWVFTKITKAVTTVLRDTSTKWEGQFPLP